LAFAFETKACVAVRPAEKSGLYFGYSDVYPVGSNFFKNMAHRLPIVSNPVLQVFSKYSLHGSYG
jgi:hypothetical protein